MVAAVVAGARLTHSFPLSSRLPPLHEVVWMLLLVVIVMVMVVVVRQGHGIHPTVSPPLYEEVVSCVCVSGVCL